MMGNRKDHIRVRRQRQRKTNCDITPLPSNRHVPRRMTSKGEGGWALWRPQGSRRPDRWPPGHMADPGTQAATADPGTQAATADPGTQAATADPGTPAAMVEQGARAAMAEQGARAAMAEQGAWDASVVEQEAWEAMEGSPPPPKLSWGSSPSQGGAQEPWKASWTGPAWAKVSWTGPAEA